HNCHLVDLAGDPREIHGSVGGQGRGTNPYREHCSEALVDDRRAPRRHPVVDGERREAVRAARRRGRQRSVRSRDVERDEVYRRCTSAALYREDRLTAALGRVHYLTYCIGSYGQ